ncbi:MAG: cytochrome P460 family protein, partial [Planctomycetaceae bacterium]|nr:cytochrome P460 family protein [Planctomycetaceae bacterium]
ADTAAATGPPAREVSKHPVIYTNNRKLCRYQWPLAEAPKGMALPEYDPDGKLVRPTGYEKWVVVGTSIGLDYSDGGKKAPNNPGTFHNVYLQPEAFEHYVATGKFPEQTVFIVTNNKSQPAKTKGTVSRSGFVAAPTSGLEIAIKDTKRYPDGWAYFMFHDGPSKSNAPVRPAERAFERKDCFDCHAEHGEVDNVFTQFYSVLTAARERRLTNDAPEKSPAR